MSSPPRCSLNFSIFLRNNIGFFTTGLSSYHATKFCTKYTRNPKSKMTSSIETFSALLIIYAGKSPETGEFPAQRPVTRSFGDFFDLRLNKRLSKHCWGWWFETPSCSLWRHSNALKTSEMYHSCWETTKQLHSVTFYTRYWFHWRK